MAKEWVIKPDARFVAQDGGVEVVVGVVDSGNREWGNDKGRKRARVEVESKHGGIKVDVVSCRRRTVVVFGAGADQFAD